MDMDFNVGDIVVDLDRNGSPIGKPYAIPEAPYHEECVQAITHK